MLVGGFPQVITFDMGKIQSISSFSFSAPGDQITPMPKNFTIEGSNDNTEWTVIKEYENFSNYTPGKTTLFVLDKSVKYRYYKFNISQDNGYGWVVMTEIQFYN